MIRGEQYIMLHKETTLKRLRRRITVSLMLSTVTKNNKGKHVMGFIEKVMEGKK